MHISNHRILTAIIAATLILFPLVMFTGGIPRIILGLCLVLFFPGYTLLSALFPAEGALGSIERIALSFGLNLAVVPLIGLILNYTPWGITLYPILISITVFILVTSAVAWHREQRLSPEERFHVVCNLKLPQWARMGTLDKGLSIGLIVAIVSALGCLGYVIANPGQGENFTEFYILGTEGKAENYPREVVVGEEARVTLGIVNHEHQPTSYQVEVRINGVKDKEIYTGILSHEEKWEKEASFTLNKAGPNQKVEFWLYKGEERKPCFEEPLHLYIDANNGS